MVPYTVIVEIYAVKTGELRVSSRLDLLIGQSRETLMVLFTNQPLLFRIPLGHTQSSAGGVVMGPLEFKVVISNPYGPMHRPREFRFALVDYLLHEPCSFWPFECFEWWSGDNHDIADIITICKALFQLLLLQLRLSSLPQAINMNATRVIWGFHIACSELPRDRLSVGSSPSWEMASHRCLARTGKSSVQRISSLMSLCCLKTDWSSKLRILHY